MTRNDAQNAFIGPNNEVKDFLKLHLYDHFPVAVCSPFSGMYYPAALGNYLYAFQLFRVHYYSLKEIILSL